MLDFLTGELDVFSARLGTEDRMKIEAHTGSIRDIEQQLDSGGGGSATCMSPAAPAGPFNMASRSAAQFGLLTVALRCDLTRVATMDVYDVHGKFGVSHSLHRRHGRLPPAGPPGRQGLRRRR